MSEVVVVAIPRENDPVWRYSSEKVPHMTLLYLGELPDEFDMEHVVEYLEHVVNGSEPFGLDVESRGPLGDDQADVLFFKKNGYDIDKPKTIREYLLDDPYIRSAYDAVEQYPEWTPHLTMGYPANPARPDNRDYPGFSWVQFEKIALWVDDSVGPTFKLEYRWEAEDRPLVIHGEHTENFLAHFGVKGMKWGVRRTPEQLNTSVETVHVTGTGKKNTSFTKEGRYQKKNADTAVTVAHRPNQRLTTKGGANRDAHDDAVKTAVNKRIARTSTTDALSTRDLQELVNRMNLEQQYERLTATPENPLIKTGKALLGDILRTEVNGAAKRGVSDALVDKGLKGESAKERESRLERQARLKKNIDRISGKAKRDRLNQAKNTYL